MEICKQYSTLGPSASKLTNTPSLWAPEFRQRSNVGHFGASIAPHPQSRRQYHTLGPQRGPAEAGGHGFLQTVQHVGPLGFKTDKQPIALGPWISESQ